MKNLALTALILTVLSNYASADPKALDGSWKLIKTTCKDKEVAPLITEFSSMSITLDGSSGTIEAQLLPPLGRKHKTDLDKVEYLSESQIAIDCSEASKANPDSTEFCKYIGRTFGYTKEGTIATLTYDDSEACPDAKLVDFYELQQ